MQQHRRLVLRSGLTFAVLFGLYVASLKWLGPVVDARLTSYLARGTASTLSLFGFDARVQGPFIRAEGFDVRIIGECTAVHVMGLFAAAIGAHPCGWRYKLLGLGFGLPLIQLFNVARLAGLSVLMSRRPDWEEFAHLVVGQSLMVFGTLLLWTIWAVALGERDVERSP